MKISFSIYAILIYVHFFRKTTGTLNDLPPPSKYHYIRRWANGDAVLGFDPMFVELLYVKPVSQASNTTVILTNELLLGRKQSAVANHRVAVLIEHVMDAQSSVFYEQKNCSPVIRVTPMIYKQNQADSRMWDIGEGTRSEMRNIHVIVLDNISAYMSSKES